MDQNQITYILDGLIFKELACVCKCGVEIAYLHTKEKIRTF